MVLNGCWEKPGIPSLVLSLRGVIQTIACCISIMCNVLCLLCGNINVTKKVTVQVGATKYPKLWPVTVPECLIFVQADRQSHTRSVCLAF